MEANIRLIKAFLQDNKTLQQMVHVCMKDSVLPDVDPYLDWDFKMDRPALIYK
jgi:hypothetical protein